MTAERKGALVAEIWLYAVAAVMLGAFSWSQGLFGSEDRWAEIAREMMLSGDWLHPAINGQVYFDKPHLSYWLIAGCARLLGGLNEFTLRLPSMLAALAGLWGTVRLGKMMFGERVALIGGWLLAGSYGFLFLGRSGEADMENMAAIVLAVAWLYRCRNGAGFWSYLLFYGICFTGALTKGLPSVIVPLALAGVVLLPGKLWLKHLKFGNFFALALVGALYLAPFWLAGIMPMPEYYTRPELDLSALELLWRENIVRAFDSFDHEEPFYIYFYEVPRLLIPWVPVFAAAIWCNCRRIRTAEPEVRMLGWMLVVIFALFTASGSRRWYYILPILPFCSLWMGVFLAAERRARWEVWLLDFMRYAVIAAASLMVLAAGFLPVLAWLSELEFPLLLYIGVPVAGALALAVALADESPKWRARLAGFWRLPESMLPMLAGGVLLIGGVFDCLLPSFDRFRTTRPFVQGELLPAAAGISPERIILLQVESRGPLIYYMDQPRPMSFVRCFFPDSSGEDGSAPLRAAEWAKFESMLEQWRDQRVLVISDTRILRKLEGYLPDTRGRFDWDSPDLTEPEFKLESSGKRKLAAWILDPAGEGKKGKSENDD